MFIPLPTVEAATTVRAAPLQMLRRPAVVWATILSAVLLLPVGMYDALWARFFADLGASTLLVGLSIVAYAIPFALLAPACGRWADRVRPYLLARVSLFTAALAMAIYAVVGSVWQAFVLSLIEAAAAVGHPAAAAAMSRASADHEQATGQGLAGSAGLAMAGLSAVVAAPLYAVGGITLAFGVGAVAVVVMGLVSWYLGVRSGESGVQTRLPSTEGLA